MLNNTTKPITGCSAAGSAPRLGRGGRTFEPCHPDHLKRLHIEVFLFLYFKIKNILNKLKNFVLKELKIKATNILNKPINKD